MGRQIRFSRPDGGELDGYLAEPAAPEAAPGVAVIQEWWGLNDQIRGVADRLAQAGYRALVPDLFRGQLALQEHEAQHLMLGLDFPGAAAQDVRGAVRHLKASGSPRVAVTGFCMGGALTVLAATAVPELDAGVIWYGCPPLEAIDATRIHAPLMGHFGVHDAVFPIALIEGLERKLREAAVAFEFHRYQTSHAFANETADAHHLPYLKYDASAAALAWHRTLQFLQRHVRPAVPS